MTLDFWKILLSKQFSNNVPSFYFKNIHTNSSFTPYQNNGGTIISINTGNFSILASDTRITSGFSIPSRDTIRILKISENILLSTSGMRADMLILQENYKKAIKLWETENKKYIPISNGAYFLSSILYSRRFFSYYTFNIIKIFFLMEPLKVFLLMQSEASNLALLRVQEQVNTLFNQF